MQRWCLTTNLSFLTSIHFSLWFFVFKISEYYQNKSIEFIHLRRLQGFLLVVNYVLHSEWMDGYTANMQNKSRPFVVVVVASRFRSQSRNECGGFCECVCVCVNTLVNFALKENIELFERQSLFVHGILMFDQVFSNHVLSTLLPLLQLSSFDSEQLKRVRHKYHLIALCRWFEVK